MKTGRDFTPTTVPNNGLIFSKSLKTQKLWLMDTYPSGLINIIKDAWKKQLATSKDAGVQEKYN